MPTRSKAATSNAASNGNSQALTYARLGQPKTAALTGSASYSWSADWHAQRIASSTDSIIGSASYTYDDFNRLSATTLGSLNLGWAYDRYGNRWSQSASGTYSGTVAQPSFTFDATNRITTSGYSYDAAGNLTADLGHSYVYDAEGNIVSVDSGATTYTFDALNRRIKATTATTTQAFDFNASGQRATVWDGSGNLISAQYYAAGQPIAYYLASDSHDHFQQQDWLGTERIRTSSTGTSQATFTSLPFGDSLAGTPDTDPYHFAALDRDSDGLDHATFRDYSSVQAHWLRPDPYDGSYDLNDPQSLNRYAYVANSPLSFLDPWGLARPCATQSITVNSDGSTSGDEPLMGNCNSPFEGMNAGAQFTFTSASLGIAEQYPGGVVGSTASAGSAGKSADSNRNGWDGNTLAQQVFQGPGSGSFVAANTVVRRATIATGVAYAAAPLAAEVGTSAVGDFFFARNIGLLNSNNFLRIGWSWYGANQLDNIVGAGGEVFRVVVGCKTCLIHWHIWS